MLFSSWGLKHRIHPQNRSKIPFVGTILNFIITAAPIPESLGRME